MHEASHIRSCLTQDKDVFVLLVCDDFKFNFLAFVMQTLKN